MDHFLDRTVIFSERFSPASHQSHLTLCNDYGNRRDHRDAAMFLDGYCPETGDAILNFIPEGMMDFRKHEFYTLSQPISFKL